MKKVVEIAEKGGTKYRSPSVRYDRSAIELAETRAIKLSDTERYLREDFGLEGLDVNERGVIYIAFAHGHHDYVFAIDGDKRPEGFSTALPPKDVCLLPDDLVLVLIAGEHVEYPYLTIVNKSGETSNAFGLGDGKHHFNRPLSVRTDGKSVYLSDMNGENGRILKFPLDAVLDKKWVEPAVLLDGVNSLCGLDVYENAVYAVYQDGILRLRDGVLDEAFARSTNSKHTLGRNALRIAVSPDEVIYATQQTSTGKNPITAFDMDGKAIGTECRKLGPDTEEEVIMRGPKGIKVGPDGIVYVADNLDGVIRALVPSDIARYEEI